ncbi:MAG: pseudouridine-5'-phosphate glycosidase [Flavobacteriales bacterium]
MNQLLHFSEEVRIALDKSKPIVALESTIISHGMPYPQNLEVAREVEETVRVHGATPATIAIINGQFHVGLSADELELFAQAKDVMKCSRRDLPFVASRRMNGATTVAATMIIAEMAGIKIFATGGIGGVHRDAENNFDISADLIEFSQTQVAVVSAGAKAILDLPKTLEYLETFGVPVIGYQTDFFPAFYTRSSELKLTMRMDSAVEMASFIQANNQLGHKGILIANPIPEEFELNRNEIEKAIQEALNEAKKNGIIGKELTPFLLKKLNDVTKGESQRANKALVLNNASVAAEIAVELTKI